MNETKNNLIEGAEAMATLFKLAQNKDLMELIVDIQKSVRNG